MTYGLVFWGNSYNSNTALKLQKRIIRIMLRIRGRKSCREYFKKLKILPLQCQYTYLLLLFVINNRQHFKIDYGIHNINTRNNLDLHYTQSQKGAHYTAIKVFSRLPVLIKQLYHDTKQFKMALKGFLYLHSFLLIGQIFQTQYKLNFKVVYISCMR
jgi:hypothetical protein